MNFRGPILHIPTSLCVVKVALICYSAAPQHTCSHDIRGSDDFAVNKLFAHSLYNGDLAGQGFEMHRELVAIAMATGLLIELTGM